MTIDTPNPSIKKVEAALSEAMPGLIQLFKGYCISENLDIHLVDLLQNQCTSETTCCFLDGMIICGSPECNGISNLGLTPEQAQQFCGEFSSKLKMVLPRLRQAVKQMGEVSKIHFAVDPTEIDEELTIQCCLINGGIVCKSPPCPNL